MAIRPETWKSLNEVLGIDAAKAKQIDPDVIRVDTTVIEANIHYPTDSSLAWDVWRTAERLLEQAREIAPELVPHRFHGKKVKKLFIFTTRYAASKDQKRRREVKRQMRTLLRSGRTGSWRSRPGFAKRRGTAWISCSPRSPESWRTICP